MTKTELLARLRDIVARQERKEPREDPESQHHEADDLLIEYIGDLDVAETYEAIERWYA